MSADPERAALEAEILAWMREPAPRDDAARFDSLARRLFALQFERCPPYRRFCEGRGRTPRQLTSWREIPAVPTGAFKELALTCFDPQRAVRVFRTSGTSTAARGTLYLDTLELYEASLLPAFRRGVLGDLPAGARVALIALAPDPAEAPDSSLSHMFGVAVRELGTAQSGFAVREGALDVDLALARLEHAAAAGAPIALCATALALLHLIEALDARGAALALPADARVMETGGFKGRARELSRDALYAEVERVLGVAPHRIVNQYGMTELGSQFYDSVLCQPDAPRHKLSPPWARVRVIDAESGAEAPSGALGSLVIADLANTGSVLCVQTADLGRALDDGFEMLGREPGAEERGCSIAADELLVGPTP